MNPIEFRLTILSIYAGLALFGVLYNLAVGAASGSGWYRGSVSYSVALGVLVTLGVIGLAMPHVLLPGWMYFVITLGGFACSGAPMIIGHRARYVSEIKVVEQARKNHKAIPWPDKMKGLRDCSAEDAMSIYRSLGHLDSTLKPADAARIATARAGALKIAAMLSQAGAPVRLDSL